MRKALKVTAIVLLVLTGITTISAVTVYLAVESMFGGSSWTYPSDDAMIAHWRKARPALERLAAMMRQDDRLGRIAQSWTLPQDAAAAGIDDIRAAQYRALMHEAGIRIVSRFGRQIEFVYYTQGFGPHARAKSFMFGPRSNDANDYVESIDGDLDAASQGRRDWYLQRRIEGDWWLMSVG